MPSTPIKGIGVGGVVLDRMPWELAPNQFSSARNVRFNNGAMETMGHPEFLAWDPGVTKPTWIHAWERDEDSDISVVVAGDGALALSSNGGAFTDVTNTTDFPSGYSSENWQSFSWGRAVVFNNGVDKPQWFDPGDTDFVLLPNWDTHPSTTTTAAVIRPFKSYMVAMDITDDSVRQDTLVEWSDVSEPNLPPPSWDWQDPSTLAGRNPLPPDTGRAIDGMTLGNSFIVYTKFAAYAMAESGDNNVFNFRRIIEHGLINKDCVATFKNYHFCVGQDRIYIHDGFTVQYPADGQVEDTFFRELAGRTSVQVQHYQRANEIFVVYDTLSQGKKTLIWNYVSNTWTTALLGQVTAMCYGPYQPAATTTFDSIASTYAASTATYDSYSVEALGQFLYMASQQVNDGQNPIIDPAVFVIDRNRTFVAAGTPPFETEGGYAERTGIDLNELFPDVENVKRVVRLAPQIDAEGDRLVQFRVGGSQFPDSAVNWGDWINFNVGQSYKVDVRLTYRYLAWAVKCDNQTWFRLSTMGIDVVEVGPR